MPSKRVDLRQKYFSFNLLSSFFYSFLPSRRSLCVRDRKYRHDGGEIDPPVPPLTLGIRIFLPLWDLRLGMRRRGMPIDTETSRRPQDDVSLCFFNPSDRPTQSWRKPWYLRKVTLASSSTTPSALETNNIRRPPGDGRKERVVASGRFRQKKKKKEMHFSCGAFCDDDKPLVPCPEKRPSTQKKKIYLVPSLTCPTGGSPFLSHFLLSGCVCPLHESLSPE